MGWNILYIGSAFQVRLRSRALQFPETSNGHWRGKQHALSTALINKGPPFNIHGGGGGAVGGRSFCRGEIIYFNPARRRAKFFKILPHVYYVYMEHIEQKVFIYRRVRSKLYNSKILHSPHWKLNTGNILTYDILNFNFIDLGGHLF